MFLITSILCLIMITAALCQGKLDGTWVVDLKPSPEAETYLKEMTIDMNGNGTFSGTFYDTPFSNGEINKAWGKVYFAFSTKAGKTEYFQAGYIENGVIRGMTFCDNRDFVRPWIAHRKEITK